LNRKPFKIQPAVWGGLLVFGMGLGYVGLTLLTGCATSKPKAPLPLAPKATEVPTPNVPSLSWRAFPDDAVLSLGPGSVTLICVGDLLFGRRVEEALKTGDVEDPFAGMRSALASGDMTTGNLECVLGTPKSFKKWKSRDKILLSSPPESARYLRAAGFRLLSLGNNHSLDYREEGLSSTIAL